MKKSDKKLLNKMHQETMPKIKTYQEYKLSFALAMTTIIHLEENYSNFKHYMTNAKLLKLFERIGKLIA